MFTRYDLLMRIGFWNENFFLDYADFELCYRFKKYGFVCIKTQSAIFEHKIGSGYKEFLGYKFLIEKPIRNYYITRDGLRLLFLSYTPFKFKLRLLFRLTVENFFNLILFGQMKERAKYMSLGLIHWIRGKYGGLRL